MPALPTRLREDSWHVYLVECCDGSLYCGMSNDVRTRVQNHNKGRGAKYTKRRLPVELVWISPPLPSMVLAMQIEWRIKRFTKTMKLSLIAKQLNPQPFNLETIKDLWKKSNSRTRNYSRGSQRTRAKSRSRASTPRIDGLLFLTLRDEG